jgi:CO dehydrogenase nickel-insertion accessory protein CooC1
MITVLDPNPVTLALFRQRKELLKKMGIKCPMAYVANMTTREFPASFVEENAGVRILEGIPYDPQMLKEVYAMNFSGPEKFKRSIDRLVRKIGLLKWESGVVEAKKRFKIFNIAGGMFK